MEKAELHVNLAFQLGEGELYKIRILSYNDLATRPNDNKICSVRVDDEVYLLFFGQNRV